MSQWQSDSSGWYGNGAGNTGYDMGGGDPQMQSNDFFNQSPTGYAAQSPVAPQPMQPQQNYGYGGQPQQQQQSYELPFGTMGGFEAQQSYVGGNMSSNPYGFMPAEQTAAPTYDPDDIENEPPLLEELGINFEHIRLKTLAVLNPLKETQADVIQDQDLAGPLVFCLLFGMALLLHGKVSFGYIYGIGVLGCVGMYALLNAMSAFQPISITCTVSVLGYCLLPMAILSLAGVLVSFTGVIGLCVAALSVIWCSLSASKLFTTALQMEHQRALVAYPCTILYALFALLAVF